MDALLVAADVEADGLVDRRGHQLLGPLESFGKVDLIALGDEAAEILIAVGDQGG